MEFIMGMIVGVIVASPLLYYIIKKRIRTVGTFVMDFTNPLKDVCRIELDENLNSLYSKKQIILRIKVYDDDSLK